MGAVSRRRRLAAGPVGLACALLLGDAGAQLGERDFRFGDDVTLTGVVTIERTPDAPNVVGGEPGGYFLLALDQPITVIGDPISRLGYGTQHDVRRLQLLRGDVRLSFGAFAERRVEASGRLMFRESPYHRTEVLLMVRKIGAAP
jgi:hypothetical protein